MTEQIHNPHDLSSNDLIFLIQKVYPDAVHGQDFWCAHQVAPNSSERTSPAQIVAWQLEAPAPLPPVLADLEKYYSDELAAYRADITRKERLPNLSPRQLWLMALDVGITKEAILASLDTLEDQREAAALRIELTEPPMNGYERFSPTVEALRTLNGIPEGQFDDLWAWAASA